MRGESVTGKFQPRNVRTVTKGRLVRVICALNTPRLVCSVRTRFQRTPISVFFFSSLSYRSDRDRTSPSRAGTSRRRNNIKVPPQTIPLSCVFTKLRNWGFGNIHTCWNFNGTRSRNTNVALNSSDGYAA